MKTKHLHLTLVVKFLIYFRDFYFIASLLVMQFSKRKFTPVSFTKISWAKFSASCHVVVHCHLACLKDSFVYGAQKLNDELLCNANVTNSPCLPVKLNVLCTGRVYVNSARFALLEVTVHTFNSMIVAAHSNAFSALETNGNLVLK